MASTTGKYKIKNTAAGDWINPQDGVHILAINGFDTRGKTVNVYHEQWVNSQTEDFLITTIDQNNNPVVVRENVDLTVVFIVGQRYTNTTIDVQTQYDTFVDYMTSSDVWIASTYVGKQVHCMCLDKVEPKTIKLKRGANSYILGEITLHALDKPTAYSGS